jgi:hypothetical protein
VWLRVLIDLTVYTLQFAALLVEALLVICCVKVLRNMKVLGIRSYFMKPVLVFGLIILGARISEMLTIFTQMPHFLAIEGLVLVIAFSILTYGVHDYNKMLKKQIAQEMHTQ